MLTLGEPVLKSAQATAAIAELHSKAGDRYSQFGEDGILAEILGRLGSREQPWCVEVGAWDGLHWSNTARLIREGGFSAVLIEADAERLASAAANHPNSRIVSVAALVSMEPGHRLGDLLSATEIPRDFDVLSIDIDGLDYHVWDSLDGYRPRIVVIEFNPTMANDLDFVQAPDPRVRQGSSPGALVRLGREKGYTPVAATLCNLFMVADEHVDRVYGGHRPSLDELRDDSDVKRYVFVGFDGTVMTNGPVTLPWHLGVEVPQRRLQVLPKSLRRFSGTYGPVAWAAFGGVLAVRSPRQFGALATRRIQRRSRRELRARGGAQDSQQFRFSWSRSGRAS